MSAIKKQGPAFYADAVAVILGIAGTIVMSVCHTMDTANPLNSFGKLIAFAVLAMVLVCASIAAANRKKDVVSLLAVMCAIALLTLNIGEIISSRILLISGLFSWNSQNMIGWRVFYVSIACIVCFVAAILALIVGAFLKNRKEG
jgi:cytochrome bd-type quinol oxidase subunit 2